MVIDDQFLVLGVFISLSIKDIRVQFDAKLGFYDRFLHVENQFFVFWILLSDLENRYFIQNRISDIHNNAVKRVP